MSSFVTISPGGGLEWMTLIRACLYGTEFYNNILCERGNDAPCSLMGALMGFGLAFFLSRILAMA